MGEKINDPVIVASYDLGAVCDIKNGCYGVLNQDDSSELTLPLSTESMINIIYYTDPICSACWALEPVLLKLELEYGAHINIEYRMGGLLRDWSDFKDSDGQIAGPDDVALHWEEVAAQSGMSIDGGIWFENPVGSSYPPSLAFKAAQLQNFEKAKRFMRFLREQLFLEKKNITEQHCWVSAAEHAGLDSDQLLLDIRSGDAQKNFELDLLSRDFHGVSSFPTLIISDAEGKAIRISGSRSYKYYAEILKDMMGESFSPPGVTWTVMDLMERFGHLSEVEISSVMGVSINELSKELRGLEGRGVLRCEKHKYGNFWRFLG